MKFTELELHLIRYAMYDLLNSDDNPAGPKIEQIITKIDKMVNKLS